MRLALTEGVEAVTLGIVRGVIQLVDGEHGLAPRAPELRAMTASASVGPSLASVRCSTTSASSTATLAWSVTRASRPTFARGSIPPVSTSVNSLPAHSARLYALSRVVPGLSETTAPRRRMILFTSELFPTLGAPTTATTGRPAHSDSRSCSFGQGVDGVHDLIRRRAVGRPAPQSRVHAQWFAHKDVRAARPRRRERGPGSLPT